VRAVDQPSFYTVSDREILLRVKAKPHARTSGVVGVRAGELVVAVRAPAEKGKATAEVIEVLARALGIPLRSVVLKSGAASPHKTIQLPPQAEATLKSLAAGAASPAGE
jgi:uncharacterized protein (TIGR00251 family)